METLTGHCLCSAVSITVAGVHDPRPGACHCRMCKRWAGGVFMCFDAQADAVTVTGHVARYASSEFSERAFCPRCGSHLWMRDTDKPGNSYELMPGLFDGATGWTIRSEIYADGAIATLNGDHPRATGAEYQATNRFVEGDA